MKISVIVPCYNVEKYIRECLDSIVGQSIGTNKLELILIDDCSTDGTLSILNEYERKYPDNVLLIPCQQNGHQGTARNIGLQYATGDYISFIDGDDFIHQDTYRVLVEIMEETDADIVQFRFGYRPEELEQADNLTHQDYKLFTYESLDKRNNYFNDYSILNGSCTTKLYKSELIRSANVHFAEGVCYEEPLFTIPLKLYVKKVAVLEKKLYYYRSNPSGTTLWTMQQANAIGGHIETQYQLYLRLKNEPLFADMKNEIDLYFLRAFYCEPFYFLCQRKMYISKDLYMLICSLIRKLLPDYEETSKRLNGKDFQLFNYFGFENPNDETIKLFTDKVFGNSDYISDNPQVKEWNENKNIALSIYENGMPDVSDEIYKNQTYTLLYGLFHMRNVILDGEKIYCDFYDSVQQAAAYNIYRKMESGKKIRVAFLPISAAQWPAEELYRLFEADNRFETIVVPMPLMDREDEPRNRTYRQVCDYFCNDNYNNYKIYDEEARMIKPWDAIGGIPDIVIHVTSWDSAYHEVYKAKNYPLTTMQFYIPYGMSLADNEDGSYSINYIYNKEIMNLCTCVYTDSKINFEGYMKYQLLHGKNVRFSGYSKMDYFYIKKDISDDDIKRIWNIQNSFLQHKRVIIAPHYSVGISEDAGFISYATFAMNYRLWPKIIEQYKDSVVFLFKPHPNLARNAVLSGLFESYEKYDEYINQLEKFANCHTVTEGDYLDIFRTSDAMIMDSGSFIGEYVYADKPMLFLTKEKGQYFNELGKKAMEIHYKCDGNSINGICEFIDSVVLAGQDVNAKKRNRFFEENLDYMNINGHLAGQYIYNDIIGRITLS